MNLEHIYKSHPQREILTSLFAEAFDHITYSALQSFLQSAIRALEQERASLQYYGKDADQFVLQFTQLQARQFAFEELAHLIESIHHNRIEEGE